MRRLLRVAIVGAPNVGKSTLLNRLVDTEISCVSQKVHTTRRNILGVVTRDDTQLEFYDSPGLITRQHFHKHRLDLSMLDDPDVAALKSDLIAVMVDASNIREQKRLNKGLLTILSQHPDKQSILILNKVDLVNDKRKLLNIGTRLTQGSIEGSCTMTERELSQLTREQLQELNLISILENTSLANRYSLSSEATGAKSRQHPYVIDLDAAKHKASEDHNQEQQHEPANQIGYRNFSRLFSISALSSDGVDELREYMLSCAKPVEKWPHGPDYITNQNSQEIVHNIVRGKVMDYVKEAVPYLIKYKYLQCAYDEVNSLHVHLNIKCPERYMVAKVIGERGVNISRVIEESREAISTTLGCDVKLNIQVIA